MDILLSTFMRRATNTFMACLLMTTTTFGQGPGGDDDLGTEPDNLPVDGGVTLLLTAGAVLGIGRLRRHVNDREKEG